MTTHNERLSIQNTLEVMTDIPFATVEALQNIANGEDKDFDKLSPTFRAGYIKELVRGNYDPPVRVNRNENKAEAMELKNERESNIKERFKEATLTDYKAKTQKQISAVHSLMAFTEKYAKGEREHTNIFLFGNKGTGKTHLATGVLNSMKKRGYTVASYRASMIKTLLNSRLEDVHKFYDFDFLLIDDIDKINVTDNSLELLYDLIDERYNSNKTTLITSNHHLDGIREILQGTRKAQNFVDPLIDRIIETSMILYIDGESYRKKEVNR